MFSSSDENSLSLSSLRAKSKLNIILKKLRSQFFKNSNDPELKRYWMPDSNSKECYDCSEKFTTIRRKHHCRVCGQIFCHKCCKIDILGSTIGYSYSTNLRACNYCYKFVTSFSKNDSLNMIDGKLNFSKEQSNKNTILKTTSNKGVNNFTSTNKNYSIPGSKELKFEKPSTNEKALCENTFLQEKKTSLISTFEQKNSIGFSEKDYVKDSLFISDFEINATNPHEFFPVKKNSHSFFHVPSYFINRHSQAKLSLSQEELHSSISLKKPSSTNEFFDKEFSKSYLSLNEKKYDISQTEATHNAFQKVLIENAETSTKNLINSGFEIQLDFKNELVSAFKLINKNKKLAVSFPTEPYAQLETKPVSTEKNKEMIVYSNPFFLTNNDSIKLTQNLDSAFEKLSNKLLIQLLNKNNLSHSWIYLIKSLAQKVSQTVSPNCTAENDEMDIQQYIKMKKISGGAKTDSLIVNGLVITKNVIHRKMNQNINNPKILLLSCPIVYHQRSGQKLTTLDSILLQEHNYLKNLVIKISTYYPDVVVVDKTFARTAKEVLLELGITLVCNVKSSVLKKISRFTGAQIVSSLEAQIGSPQLGHCERFYVKSFGDSKTLMFFEGCSPELGCTLVLRGSQSEDVLKKVKKTLYFMIYCYYNWRLERSLLIDLNALPPQIQNDDLSLSSNIDKMVNCNSSVSKNDSQQLKVARIKIEDDSDPLRIMTSEAENNLSSSQISSVKNFKPPDSKTFSENFLIKKVSHFLSNNVLICSLFISMDLPYFLSKEGALCPLKKYFDIENSFWFEKFKNEKILNKKENLLKVEDAASSIKNKIQTAERLKTHAFITRDLKHKLNSVNTLDLLADFRARGSTYPKLKQISLSNNITSSINVEPVVDPLSEKYHQRLPILYFSFSYSSSLSPFCLNPWIVMMEFYGSRDISLGTFLEKYCFNNTYACPAVGCSTPMVQHIRKFVHGKGAVIISSKEINDSLECAEANVVTWSVCQKCGMSSFVSKLSKDTKSLSFAKFLELKLYSDKYGVIGSNLSSKCSQHSLFHDFIQYFAYKKIVASFNYQPITINELTLPSPKIKLQSASLSTFFVNNDANIITDPTSFTVSEKLSVIINENDFGSIIAHFLSSSEYEKQLNDFIKSSASPCTKKKLLISLESSLNSFPSEVKDNQFEVSIGSSAVSFNSKVPINQCLNNPHINLQCNHGTTEFFCCVYFADQFRKLRSELISLNKMCFNLSNSSTSQSNYNSLNLNSVEEAYIKSLSHCIPWLANGGKSGARFCKTADDRFILKEMKKAELHSFLSIAKCYFDYIIFALHQSKPTLLAKIFGIYKISFKNATNSISKMYLLVMENLFYNRNISLKYDLKGSVRNRFASTDTDNDVVLLDENLITIIKERPFYVRSHTKKILQTAIDNDSSFLSFLSIMDYSLLVGVDEDRKEFVVGIIDYIRPYTWDKKIEMMVKSVGGHGMPTIVSPDVYKERFCDKMNQYFLCVPDRWYRLESLDKPFARLEIHSSFA